MKDRPLVSTIINNYNYGHFLREAIDSVLNQTYSHTEIIVVDDGSTDNSREIIANYKDRIIPVLKDNGGQASAFNAGVAASKGYIICFLDADDIFLPEKVAKVVDVFRNYQDIGWCFHSQRVVDVDTGALLRISRESSSRECDFRPHIRRGKESFIAPATSGLCLTHSLLEKILPLPESKTHKTAADRYIKVTALALSKGFFLAQELTIQRIHGDNAYTAMEGKQRYMAKGLILTADWKKAKFPELSRLADKLFALGLGTYWRTGGVEATSRECVKSYLSAVSPLEKLEISLRAFYHCLRLWYRS